MIVDEFQEERWRDVLCDFTFSLAELVLIIELPEEGECQNFYVNV